MKTAARILAAAMTLALGVAAPAMAQTDDLDAYADDYQAGNFGRVRFAEGGITILRADGQTDSGDRAGVNAPIFPGDALRTDSGGRAEVQLANGTLLRLDRDSEVVFQSLPEPGAKYQDNSVLVLSGGVLRVATRGAGKDEFRIDTRDASVYLLDDAEVRLDVDARGGTRVTSVRGVAEVVGADSSVLVRGGTGTHVISGEVPEEPQAYSALGNDGFDRWCASRDASYRRADVAYDDRQYREDVPTEVRPYYNELSAYGSWTNVPTYGDVWYPGNMPAGWRPYSNGYWNYGPGGYFWVSYEPWGWAPYHYGNWQWVGGYGWCWIPGNVFAGAWVSWSWGSLYVGWSPLDYWGRPGWGGGAYYHGYYDPGCWTFVNYNNIYASNVHRYAVPVGTIGDDLRHANVVSRPPRVDPRRIATSREVRQKAYLEAGADRSAHMRPIDRNQVPTRTLADVQTHLSQRGPTRTITQRGVRAQDRQTPEIGKRQFQAAPGNRQSQWERPRRILEDPRAHEQAGRSQDGVRDLYQRMSRPRETRPQGTVEQPRSNPGQARKATPQRVDQRPYRGPERQAAPQRQPQRVEPQRSYRGPERQAAPQRQPQRVEPQRSAPQRPTPRMEAPRPQGGSRQAAPAPRSQPKPQGGQGRAKPDHGNGGGSKKH